MSSLTTRKSFNTIGYNNFLKPFCDSINQINDNPLSLSNGLKIKIMVGPFVADNKESNSIADLNGFSAGTYSCKWCLAGYDEIQEDDAFTVYDARDQINTILDICPHTEERLSPDILHDFLCKGNLLHL